MCAVLCCLGYIQSSRCVLWCVVAIRRGRGRRAESEERESVRNFWVGVCSLYFPGWYFGCVCSFLSHCEECSAGLRGETDP